MMMLKIQQILLISMQSAFQINFQAVFHCDCAKNLMQNGEDYMSKMLAFLLVSFTLDDIIINTKFEASQNDRLWLW